MSGRRAFHHTDFDRDAFEVELFDEPGVASEAWSAKPKAQEIWSKKPGSGAFALPDFDEVAFDAGEIWTTNYEY